MTKSLLFVIIVCSILVLMIKPHFSQAECPEIVSRESWGADEPESVKTLRINPPPYVVVHHSAGQSCDSSEKCAKIVKNTQTYHMKTKGWEDIGYNFMIGGDGKVYEGRGWGVHGAHVLKYNAKSIGVCLLGTFQSSEPPKIMIETLRNFIECGVEKGKITEDYSLIGHRQGSATLCPGDSLYNLIKTWNHFNKNP